MTMLSTPEHIKAYALLALIAAFEIEIHTGRKVTRVPLVKHTRKRYGTKSRTKAGTLEELYIIREEMTAQP